MRYAGCEKLDDEEEGSTDQIQDADFFLHPVHNITLRPGMIIPVASFTQLPA
jgi:hypothetical protein